MRSVRKALSHRPVFFAVGLLNIVLFHWAILRLWFFLYDAQGRNHAPNGLLGWGIDFVLISFFTIPHSLLLWPKFKTYFVQFVPPRLFPTIYSLHACLGILLMDRFWVNLGPNIFDFNLVQIKIIDALYGSSWALMFWSMLATGLLKQNGVEEWWRALREKRTKFRTPGSGPYQFCRHPIYVSFLGMIWFTPNMGPDRLFLAVYWTVYIGIGVVLKERRLKGNRYYMAYSQEVSLFPLIPRKLDQFVSSKIWGF